jgi:hypothetical protein
MPASSPQQRKLSDQLSTLAQIDKAIARRIAEAEQADANLQTRLDLLNKAEASLQSTLESARNVVAEALPLLRALPQLHQSVQVAQVEVQQRAQAQTAHLLEEFSKQLQTKLDEALVCARFESAVLAEEWAHRREQIDQEFTDQSDYLQRCAAAGRESLSSYTNSLVADLDSAAGALVRSWQRNCSNPNIPLPPG